MSEQVAVVVGAGGGLGSATALVLANAGFSVTAVDRTEKALDQLPDGIHRVVGDATDPVVARNVVDRIATESGPPRYW